jgi:N-acetylmuramoyl-L-alanine amidase
MSRLLPHFLSFPFILLLLSSSALAGDVAVEEISHTSNGDRTRVVIRLSGSAEFEKKRILSPDRLFVDIKGGRLSGGFSGAGAIDVGDGIVRRIRAAQHDGSTARVVLDLDKAGDFKVASTAGSSVIVIEVFGASEAASRDDADVSLCRVVVDAGHGGHDPGAVGPRGIKEKDVVLDIALRVKKALEGKGCEVFLTRDRDVFLTLEERSMIANRKGADLFVSIHANASRKRSARGIETYLLNWTDDEEAMKVAARENQISLKRMKQDRSELDIILASLELQNKRDESLRLAHRLQDSMVSSLGPRFRRVTDLGVKQALFYVLVGARMPSALVEVSFITNHEEARRLKSPEYRGYLARGIAGGIMQYMRPSADQKVALK